MKVVLMANNWGGLQILKALQLYEEEVIGLVVHEPGKRKYTGDIVLQSGLSSDKIIRAKVLRKPGGIQWMKDLKPDIIVCAFFGYLLKKPILGIPKHGCINLRPSYLPINRGWQPNEWPIIDGSAAGVSIHYIDEGADTGPVIARRRIDITAVDTGESVHRKLVYGLMELFIDEWPNILETQPTPQNQLDEPTHHTKNEIDKFNELELSEFYNLRELLDVLRARTYPPYPGCYYIHPVTKEKIYVWIKLLTQQDMDMYKGEVPLWE